MLMDQGVKLFSVDQASSPSFCKHHKYGFAGYTFIRSVDLCLNDCLLWLCNNCKWLVPFGEIYRRCVSINNFYGNTPLCECLVRVSFPGKHFLLLISLQWFETSLCVSCDTFMTLRAEAAGVKQGELQ